MEWRARKDHHQTCSTHALHTQAGTYMRATDTYTTIPRITPGMPRRRMHQSCPGIRLFFKKKGGGREYWEYWVKLELKRKMKKSKWFSTISNAYTAPGRMVRRSDVDVLHCGVLCDLIYILKSIINREKERSRESVREFTKWNDVGSHVLSSGFPPIHPLPLLGELIFPPFRFLVPATLKGKGK